MMCMYRNALQFHGTVIASDKDVDRSETPAFNMGTVHIESKYFYAKGITFLFLEVKECEQSHLRLQDCIGHSSAGSVRVRLKLNIGIQPVKIQHFCLRKMDIAICR